MAHFFGVKFGYKVIFINVTQFMMRNCIDVHFSERVEKANHELHEGKSDENGFELEVQSAAAENVGAVRHSCIGNLEIFKLEKE